MRDREGNILSNRQIANKGLQRISTIALEFEVMLLNFVSLFPSHMLRLFFFRICGMKIGKGSSLHSGVKLYDSRNIVIGQDSIVGEGTVLDGRQKLHIGNHVDIASEVMIYNGQHDIQSPDFHAVFSPVVIEDYVFIGPRVIILPGVKIGKGAVIAAGAVVTRDILPFEIAAGIPAKAIGKRDLSDPHYSLGRPALFR